MSAKLKHDYEEKTGLSKKTFPVKCPFTLAQCLDSQFFPEDS